jgi:hypothetical protein
MVEPIWAVNNVPFIYILKKNQPSTYKVINLKVNKNSHAMGIAALLGANK